MPNSFISGYGYVLDKYSICAEGIDRHIGVLDSHWAFPDNPRFPLHDDCLFILEQFVKRLQKRAYGPTVIPVLLEDLYAALVKQYQCHSSKKKVDEKIFCLEWEHGFYGARQCWGPQWVRREGPNAGLESLPPELLLSILSYLPTPDIFRLSRCSRTLSLRLPLDQRRFWREGLLRGDLIGWLWDLDADACRAVDHAHYATGKAAGGWDWRGLVLRLARCDRHAWTEERMDLRRGLPDAEGWVKWFEGKMGGGGGQRGSEDGELGDAEPAGLRNRRRIWRIVEGLRRSAVVDGDGVGEEEGCGEIDGDTSIPTARDEMAVVVKGGLVMPTPNQMYNMEVYRITQRCRNGVPCVDPFYMLRIPSMLRDV
ncbi:MAG: hypothetical protein M1816_001661 [Peltula sp. TS41687]|nr:MAG: hypothetical protein M1816_001661 [Peltula sp. TS41687]